MREGNGAGGRSARGDLGGAVAGARSWSVIALCLTVGSLLGAGTASAGTRGLKLLGYLQQPKAAAESAGTVPFAIDETRRRLYGYYTQPGPSTHIVEYDLRQTIPR